MNKLEKQARKEAEDRYPPDNHTAVTVRPARSLLQHARMEAYAAALVSERSKHRRDIEELGFARIRIDALNAQLKGCEEALAQRDANPSIMVGFSEEEITRYSQKQPVGEWSRKEVYARAVGIEMGLRIANTRAVSIDKIMDVVQEWVDEKLDDGEASGLHYISGHPKWEAVFADLRERLTKLVQ